MGDKAGPFQFFSHGYFLGPNGSDFVYTFLTDNGASDIYYDMYSDQY